MQDVTSHNCFRNVLWPQKRGDEVKPIDVCHGVASSMSELVLVIFPHVFVSIARLVLGTLTRDTP
jgi:hypothetical protein